jgi:hypothetical protein
MLNCPLLHFILDFSKINGRKSNTTDSRKSCLRLLMIGLQCNFGTSIARIERETQTSGEDVSEKHLGASYLGRVCLDWIRLVQVMA